MPQPYRGNGELYFAQRAMVEHPELGAPIAAIATIWTASEDLWGVILATLLDVHAETGLDMYHSLVGTGAQRAVLDRIALDRLRPDLMSKYRAVLKTAKARAIERNAIVHGMWFHDTETPDTLVLAPRNVFSQLIAKNLSKVLLHKLSATRQPFQSAGLNYVGWLSYKPKDFTAVIERLRDFFRDQDDLFDHILASKGLPGFGPPARPPLADLRGAPRSKTKLQ